MSATNASGTSAWTNVRSFTIAPLPDIPTLSSPADGFSSTSSPLLVWNPAANATSYNLQVVVSGISWDSSLINQTGLTGTSYQTNLSPNTYYWWVSATNASGTSAWSEVRRFTTRLALTVANPFSIPILTNAFPVFKHSLTNPPLFAGNMGTLVFTASSSNPAICTVSILESDTLIVTGLWSGEVTVIVVAIDVDGTTASYTVPVQLTTAVEGEENIPREFSLSQNYPNPFNPTTSIKYTVVSSVYVTLTVYDVLGREVAVLVDGEKLPGTYEVEFNASNLPSGVYLYRLQTGNFVETKRMLLLK